MDELTKLSVDDFLDRIADRVPTPGGGGVTGLAGALACALATMVASYSLGRKTAPDRRARIERFGTVLTRAGQLLRALITQDAGAYDDMTAAARTARENPSGEAAYREAVLAAAAVPMEMAAVASNALAAMDEFKAVAGRRLLSDLAIAAILADSAARTARYTVHVNAGELADAEKRRGLLNDIDNILRHCAAHRESIELYVRDHLERDPLVGR